ncbi:acyl-CoA dehydrogenase family protein [Geobacillus sp. FSL W8-0032]|uniref:Acyl-CoA dehydrogenase, short-chain specific n=1 Tax=Geobacillus icigianus TaxID=1430331 RepID=A0ABU6BDX6_9BACL|nr:acyl-CoA dehydrogenase family protein [Geobacillus icigianus]MEB3750147.1 Acyl-CoA dehydrogenase, short-chain specific [Geobacillus icigianus]
MISFRPTEEERAFCEVAKTIAVEEMRPSARDCEQRRSVSASIAKRLHELGFLGLELPESWGGLELPLISQAQIWQVLSYGDLGIVQGLPGPGEAASLMRQAPEHPVWRPYRDAGQTGIWPTVAFIDGEETIEVRRSRDGYRLNGTSAPVRRAAFADWVVAAGKDNEGEPVIVVFDERTWETIEGDFRLGLLAAGLGRIRFSDVFAGNDRVLARGEEASALLGHARARQCVLEAAKEVGLMEAALDYTIEYTAGRKAFGQEIAKFQGVSFTVAEMAFECRGARNIAWAAACRVDEQGRAAEGFAWRALARAHRSVRYVTDQAVQMLGGHGYVQEYPAEKWMRDAQAQVLLYARETDWFIRRGEQLLDERKERVAP